jgi:hypothetical protein
MKTSRIKNRLWLLPFISFIIIVILEIVALYLSYLDYKSLEPKEISVMLIKRLFYFWNIVWYPLLILEAITYYKIRRLLFNQTWVFLHFIFTVVAFVVIPVLSPFLTLHLSPDNTRNFFFYRKLLSWLCLICGHLFFILTIVKSFKKPELVHEPPGLLDEFVS